MKSTKLAEQKSVKIVYKRREEKNEQSIYCTGPYVWKKEIIYFVTNVRRNGGCVFFGIVQPFTFDILKRRIN